MRLAHSFNTHSYVKRLVAAGVPEAQAEIHAEVFVETIIERLATKDDLAALEQRLRAEIKQESAGVRAEMKDMEMRLTLRVGAMIAAGIAVEVALDKLL